MSKEREHDTQPVIFGTDNPFIKRLGLVIIIIACFASYFSERPILVLVLVGGTILLAIIWGIIKIIINIIKTLF